jgi:hypothetical protein
VWDNGPVTTGRLRARQPASLSLIYAQSAQKMTFCNSHLYSVREARLQRLEDPEATDHELMYVIASHCVSMALQVILEAKTLS